MKNLVKCMVLIMDTARVSHAMDVSSPIIAATATVNAAI